MTDSFQFLRPAALLLAPVVALLWRWWQRRNDPLRGWRSQVEPELLEALAEHPGKARSRPWPLLVGWLLAVTAIAGPSWRPEPSPFAEDATPLVILLKADLGMDTPDPAPSRIERAHLKIRDLAATRKGQPLALIAYAGSAHLVLPPTRDTAAVATMAAEITPAIMPAAGDRLDRAIDRAARLLDGEGGTILVITDTAVSATPALSESHRNAGSPFIQILAITPPGTATDSLDPVARVLDAEVIAMSTDGADVDRIVRNARRPPVARAADGSTRRQDGGYLLVPLIAILALLPFRREAPLAANP